MLIKKASLLGAAVVLSLGLASSNVAAAVVHHYHFVTVVCHEGSCKHWVKNYTRVVGGGHHYTYRTHYRYHTHYKYHTHVHYHYHYHYSHRR